MTATWREFSTSYLMARRIAPRRVRGGCPGGEAFFDLMMVARASRITNAPASASERIEAKRASARILSQRCWTIRARIRITPSPASVP